MGSTVQFPSKYASTESRNASMLSMDQVRLVDGPARSSELSVLSRQGTALDICEYMYGNSPASSFLDAESFYEPNAGIYENPLLTATSRSIISDIYNLTRRLSSVDIPKPLAMLYILLRLRPPEGDGSGDPWFRGLRVWSEVGEISESENVDGHRNNTVEHTLNILLLPGLHTGSFGPRPLPSHQPPTPHSGASSAPRIPTPESPLLNRPLHVSVYGHYPSDPSLPVPGTSLAIPSPLHFQLHIHTKLSFNEQGRITYHRDIWDVKDVIGLVPGMGIAQWIAGRMAARSVAWASRTLLRRFGLGGSSNTTNNWTSQAETSPEHRAENGRAKLLRRQPSYTFHQQQRRDVELPHQYYQHQYPHQQHPHPLSYPHSQQTTRPSSPLLSPAQAYVERVRGVDG
ncbi:hypothetical protein CONPUDRAFT_139657 [Coniophora puteana RWD-64-598 SS2]|uniref:Uncharacterized protein n=1 Tax=Coniophora puteana (strain RWD-64-598) TaxID=741705 RepID=A0A5M3MC54_CONPW|nr:uncharacterized protein CONPUDRAFT_139657 [Coniophora puteana RWD-64-598 SS2]EIW76231.1 hypothetical protein CONPUDRAFT_139657 [Coniophora puteana RWD-64-598 SS2]